MADLICIYHHLSNQMFKMHLSLFELFVFLCLHWSFVLPALQDPELGATEEESAEDEPQPWGRFLALWICGDLRAPEPSIALESSSVV